MSTVPDLKHHHIGISVPDIDIAVRWWKDMLGFAESHRFYIEHAGAQVVFLSRADLNIELSQTKDAAPLPDDRRIPILDLKTHGNKHGAFRVDDLDELLAYAEAKGADVAMGKTPVPIGLVCFLRDPAGNLIEFVQESPEFTAARANAR